MSLISDEWEVCQGEGISENMWKRNCKLRRIDHSRRDILQLKPSSWKDKQTRLKEMVNGVLALPHSNADVERGMSDNKKMLTLDRVYSSKESSIGNRLTKEAVKIHDPEETRPEWVPFTKALIIYVKSSHRTYLKRKWEKREIMEVKRKQEKEGCAKLEKKNNNKKQAPAKENESLNKKMKRLNDR